MSALFYNIFDNIDGFLDQNVVLGDIEYNADNKCYKV